jgi:hypothetical protein|tara:strand:- start:281 stop:487 length:207 start_codon:yes stop_codon:yes gene_type:complete
LTKNQVQAIIKEVMPRKKKTELSKRYQAVYDSLYEELPRWKKEAMEDDDERISHEFAKEVIELAEKED